MSERLKTVYAEAEAGDLSFASMLCQKAAEKPSARPTTQSPDGGASLSTARGRRGREKDSRPEGARFARPTTQSPDGGAGFLRSAGRELDVQRGRFVDAEQKPAPEYTDRESRELVAITADLGLLVCHGGRESRAVRSMLDACRRRLALDRELRWTLREAHAMVRDCPEKALDQLVKLRAAVLVPIHDLLSEKLLGPEKAAELRHRTKPPSATPLCFSAATSTG